MFNKIITFLKEVRVELKKVNWLTKDEAIKYTAIVIGLSLSVAVFLGAFDWLFTFILQNFVIR
jgi:preprotein translocase subunit SecE